MQEIPVWSICILLLFGFAIAVRFGPFTALLFFGALAIVQQLCTGGA